MYTPTNMNLETGIRYGMLSFNSLNPDMEDEFYNLPNPSIDASFKDYLEDLAIEYFRSGKLTAADFDLEPDVDLDTFKETVYLSDLDTLQGILESIDPWVSESFYDGLESSLVGCEGIIDGVTVRITELGGALMLWIFDSPHTTKARLCSPCVPNAGDLDSLDPENGYETYTVPSDWLAKEES